MSKKMMTVRICSACGKHIMCRANCGFSCYFAHTWTDLKMTKGARQLDVGRLLLVKCPHCFTLLWIEEQEKVGEINSRVPDSVLPDTGTTTNDSYKPSSVRELIEFERADAHEKEHDKYKQLRAWMMVQIGADSQDGETGCMEKQIEMAERFKDAKRGSEPTFMEYMDFLSMGVPNEEKEAYLRLHAWWAGNDSRRQGGQFMPMTPLEQANLRAFLPYLDEKSRLERLMKAEIFRELGKFAEAEKLLTTPNADFTECFIHIRDLNKKQSTSVAEVTSMYLNPDITGMAFRGGLGLGILMTSHS
jgi:hypothetical protein